MRSLEARRAATLVLLVIIAGAGVLAYGPFALGTLRVGGVSLIWWYVAAVAPMAAAALALAALLVRRT